MRQIIVLKGGMIDQCVNHEDVVGRVERARNSAQKEMSQLSHDDDPV
jgi:hypothetical protein